MWINLKGFCCVKFGKTWLVHLAPATEFVCIYFILLYWVEQNKENLWYLKGFNEVMQILLLQNPIYYAFHMNFLLMANIYSFQILTCSKFWSITSRIIPVGKNFKPLFNEIKSSEHLLQLVQGHTLYFGRS
jgi:hypothetical protein